MFAQVDIGTAEHIIEVRFPELAGSMAELRLSRTVTTLGLFGSLYLLF
ncbi:MAG: hypothetical protein O3C52_11050 [Proteobacteria bacterium]|nr:hypothetical protein [Pseudomonadota bacterium]